MQLGSCTLYLVRHAESVVNAQLGAPAQYSFGGSPLTARGRQQAADLAHRLQPIPVGHIYTSDARRAVETATLLASGQPIHTTPRLREGDQHNPASTEYETPAKVALRLTLMLQEIIGAHPGESVIVVSHGYAMRSLLVSLGYATFEELPGGAILNTGYVQLISDGGQFIIADVVGVQKTTAVAK